MKKIIEWIDRTPVTKFLSSILIMLMAVIMVVNVFTRFFLGFSFNWGDEIIRYMCVYMSFLGIAAGFRYSVHIGVSVFVEKLFPEGVRKYFRILADIITIVFLVLLIVFGYILVQRIIGSGQTSAALKVPMYMIYGIVPVSAVISIAQILIQIFVNKSYLVPRE